MLVSKFFIATQKEDPADAVIISHKLMIRAGLIRKLSAGLYSYLPLGLRVFTKIVRIIREEMNRSGALEFSLPILTPSELWEASGRWNEFGPELIRIKDRNERWNALGPTHEEVFTEIVKNEITSYRQLPVNFYQIKTKFRDEIRPRFGVMRCKEFTMKDAYSFDADPAGLDRSYDLMRKTYTNIFRRCGLAAVAVQADTGAMGGTKSEEFMVLSRVGEEVLVTCEKCAYAANLEKAESRDSRISPREEKREREVVETPRQRTIEELTAFFKTTPDKFIKTIIYVADGKPVAVLIRGDLEINDAKLKNHLKAVTLELAGADIIRKVTGAETGFAGPVGLGHAPLFADFSVRDMSNAIAGANQTGRHIRNVDPARDFKVNEYADIRKAREGDLCPACGAPLVFKKGIEVGHIFKLGTRYTQSMNVKFLTENQKEETPLMGCYGIGVDRTMAAIIEQSNDKDGIIFPITVAPFEIMILPIVKDLPSWQDTILSVYQELDRSYEVLMDDRNVSPGFKFKDADLMGIPVRVILGERNLKEDNVEIKIRGEGQSILVKKNDLAKKIHEIIQKEYQKYDAK